MAKPMPVHEKAMPPVTIGTVGTRNGEPGAECHALLEFGTDFARDVSGDIVLTASGSKKRVVDRTKVVVARVNATAPGPGDRE